LCSIRIVRKVPDLAENFMGSAASLLKEKHHGVLLSAVQLCTELCKASIEALEYLRKVPCCFMNHCGKPLASFLKTIHLVMHGRNIAMILSLLFCITTFVLYVVFIMKQKISCVLVFNNIHKQFLLEYTCKNIANIYIYL
jgi:hypothetical protein